MRSGRVLATTVAALIAAAAFGLPSAQAATVTSPGGWLPYRTAPWTDAPGSVCVFGVTAAIVEDQEQVRTLATYPDGSPQLQEFRGPLVIRYTNTSSGAWVVRDLSGYAWFHYDTGGGLEALVASHIAVTVHVGNTRFPAGEWVISGRSEVTVDSAGAISVRLIHATAENLCTTLS
jgi:hypothetical protein